MKNWFLLFLLLQVNFLSGQSLKREKMNQLSYLVGEWIGTSTQFIDGEVSKQVPAFERIYYDLNNSILVVELNTELLKLHTIIYFDEKENTYFYNPFSENGARKLPAEFVDGRLVINASDSKRFIFEKYEENGFREYGEELKDGQWIKYFEDIFTNTR